MKQEQTESTATSPTSGMERMVESPSGPAQMLRRWRPSTVVRERGLGTSGIFNSQTWLELTPWRLAAAWSALAGLLASGFASQPTALSWPLLVLLFVLVDPLWSGIWRLAAGRAEILPLRDSTRPPSITLPYLQPGSAAAQLFDRNSERVLPVLMRVGLPGLLLALVVASAINGVAVAMTLLVVIAAAAGWIGTRRSHRLPILLFSLVSIGLPWLLAAWTLLDSASALMESGQLPLIALWVLHGWGAGRLVRFEDERFGLLLMGLADAGIFLLLIWAMAPLWLAFWLVLTLPIWLLAYRGTIGRSVEFWHLGAMLVSAAALGQVF